jgi:hypothetical protein
MTPDEFADRMDDLLAATDVHLSSAQRMVEEWRITDRLGDVAAISPLPTLRSARPVA